MKNPGSSRAAWRSSSSDGCLDIGDTVIEQRRNEIGRLRVDRHRRRNIRLRTTVNPVGSFLVLDVDPAALVEEITQNNNRTSLAVAAN